MTGSKAQWYNGMLLLSTFFCCRLVWGTYQSVCVFADMWRALSHTWSFSASSLDPVNISAQVFESRDGALCMNEDCVKAQAEIDKYSSFTAAGVPTWLVVTYLVSNVVLNVLNYYWFSKMIETVLKRFRGPPAKKEKTESSAQEILKAAKEEDADRNIILEAAAKLEHEQGGTLLAEEQRRFASALNLTNDGLVEELRKRKNNPAATATIPPT